MPPRATLQALGIASAVVLVGSVLEPSPARAADPVVRVSLSYEVDDSDGTPGVVLVDPSLHYPPTLGLPASWSRADEWYHLSQPLGPEITVLASLDEDAHRPVSWVHELAGGGRMFYTTQGHNISYYAEPLFRTHILGAVEWAAHRQDAKPGSAGQ